MTLEQILPWVLLLSIVAFAAWWIFRPSARSRKTDFRVITASAGMLVMAGGFIFWQSGFQGGGPTQSNPAPVLADGSELPEGPCGSALCELEDNAESKVDELRAMAMRDDMRPDPKNCGPQQEGNEVYADHANEHGEIDINWWCIQGQWRVQMEKVTMKNWKVKRAEPSSGGNEECGCDVEREEAMAYHYVEGWTKKGIYISLRNGDDVIGLRAVGTVGGAWESKSRDMVVKIGDECKIVPGKEMRVENGNKLIHHDWPDEENFKVEEWMICDTSQGVFLTDCSWVFTADKLFWFTHRISRRETTWVLNERCEFLETVKAHGTQRKFNPPRETRETHDPLDPAEHLAVEPVVIDFSPQDEMPFMLNRVVPPQPECPYDAQSLFCEGWYQ